VNVAADEDGGAAHGGGDAGVVAAGAGGPGAVGEEFDVGFDGD
jgi:hypothetical protein